MTDTAPAALPGMPHVGTDGVIVLDGRRFRVTEQTTARQDLFVMGHLERAGLEKLQGQMDDAGDLTELAVQLLGRAYANDTLFEVAAAILTEIGPDGEPLPVLDAQGRPQRWSKEKTLEVADFLANLTDERDKQALNGVMTNILVLFFTTAAASFTVSRTSSAATTSAVVGGTAPSVIPSPASSFPADASGDTMILLSKLGVDPASLDPGLRSSAPSPGTTPTDSTDS